MEKPAFAKFVVNGRKFFMVFVPKERITKGAGLADSPTVPGFPFQGQRKQSAGLFRLAKTSHFFFRPFLCVLQDFQSAKCSAEGN